MERSQRPALTKLGLQKPYRLLLYNDCHNPLRGNEESHWSTPVMMKARAHAGGLGRPSHLRSGAVGTTARSLMKSPGILLAQKARVGPVPAEVERWPEHNYAAPGSIH